MKGRPIMKDRGGRIALCAGALLLACSCTQADAGTGAEDVESPDGQHVTITALTTHPGPAEEAGDAARLTGVLKLHNGCLVVVPEGGAAPVVPVFPDRAVDETGDGLVFTDAEDRTLLLAEGEQVDFGGGGGEQESCLPGAATFTVWRNG